MFEPGRLPANRVGDRAPACCDARRSERAEREPRVVEGLSGVAMAEIARREGISERGLRKYVRNLIARRAPEATGEFTALQMSRLNEALLMSFGTMSRTNLPAVDQVVRIVRELDHYQGLGRGARGTETRRKLLKSLDSGAGMAPVTPPFAESRSREASGEDAAADGTPEIDASRRLASPLGRAGKPDGDSANRNCQAGVSPKCHIRRTIDFGASILRDRAGDL